MVNNNNSFTIQNLLKLTVDPVVAFIHRKINNWWQAQVEKHCEICAAHEDAKALEHTTNAKYYRTKMLTARNRVIR